MSNRHAACPDRGGEYTPAVAVEVKRYQKAGGWLTRYWAVYVNGELLAVVLYRKGAMAITEALRVAHQK